MADVTWDGLQREGYDVKAELRAALPMTVWAVDLEVERLRAVSAAELAVLKLLEAGTGQVPELTQAVGMGSDERLVERVLVKLLSHGAVETQGELFVMTSTGAAWRAEGNALARERVTVEIRHDPARDHLEWMDQERPVFATSETWTIDLPEVTDAALLARRAEIGKLVRDEGLPDDEDRSPVERRGQVDLRSVAIVSRRLHWRPVRIDVMGHALHRDPRLIGYISDAENPPLTRLVGGHVLVDDHQRLRPRG